MEALMATKGRRKAYRSIWQILWIALVLSISSAGVSMAWWQDGTQTKGIVKTGHIKPVFTNVNRGQVYSMDSPCSVIPEIMPDGRTILLTVDNPYPNYTVQLDYKITNQGNIPVRYVLDTPTYENDGSIFVEVVNQFPKYPSDVVLEGGKSAEGTLTLSVNSNIPEEDIHTLQVQVPMHFQQAIPY